MPLTLSCRYYEDKCPDVDDLVLVEVTRVEPVGVYVTLPEYADLEGFIHMAQVSRVRIRSLQRLVRPGMRKTARVVRVPDVIGDVSRDVIDLSLIQMTRAEKDEFNDRYAKAKVVSSILCYTAEVAGFKHQGELEEMYDKTAWEFDRRAERPGVGGYDAFKRSTTEPSVFDLCDLDAEVRCVLVNHIAQKLAPREVKVYAEIAVNCFTPEGIDAIKAALKSGLSLSTKEQEVKIYLTYSPVYAVCLYTTDAPAGVKLIHDVIARVETSIVTSGGKLRVTTPPKYTTLPSDDSGYCEF